MITTSTPALSSGSASLSITTAAINLGTAALPLYGLTPDGTRAGAFITATPDFVGTWMITRRTPGSVGSSPVQQRLLQGDQTYLFQIGAGSIANLAGTDLLTLAVTSCSSGSIMLTVVQ